MFSLAKSCVRGLSAALTFHTIIILVRFLSFKESEDGKRGDMKESLGIDAALVFAFICQHSLFKSSNLEPFIREPGLRRTLYVWSLCPVVHVLIHFWEPISENILWDGSSKRWVNFSVGGIHCFSWYLIYASFLIMDFPDLSGADTSLNDKRTPSLNRFFGHYRHGSFTGFLLILCVRSVMTLDRALLAILWIFYMYIAWRPDEKDLEYQKAMWTIKRNQLSNL